jgi:Peroxiredoxin
MKKVLFLMVCVAVFCSCGNRVKDEKKDATQVAVNDSSTSDTPYVDKRGYIVKVGDEAPDFTITLTDGKSVTLSSLKGKIVMLQFTASWCGVCRKEMPFIEKDIWQKHKNDPNFVLIGIDRDEPVETVEEFKKSTGVSYPLGLDPNGDIFGLFADKKAGITRNVIIDKTGTIVMLTRLYNEEEFSLMCAKIEELLK